MLLANPPKIRCRNFKMLRAQQLVGAAKVEAFLREHLQPVSNALLLEIRTKRASIPSSECSVVNAMTRQPAANKAYRAQPKPDHKLMTTTNPWNLMHQGTCNKSPRPSHARCLAQWSCSPTFSTRELFGKISFGLSHSIGVWRQVSYERC